MSHLHSNYHSPAAKDPAVDLTGAQSSDAASSGHADGTADTPNTSPSPWDPGSTSDFGLRTGSEQLLTPGGPQTSFAQPMSVDDDSPDLFSKTGHWASDAPTRTQQESPTFEGVVDEILRQPLPVDDESAESADPVPAIDESISSEVLESAQQEQQSCSGVSSYDLFHVSFASNPDLETLSKIHASASALDTLTCSMMYDPLNLDDHLELGRFHYGQAFAAKNGAVILKATNHDSGELVGCAWLQLHIFYKRNKQIPYCQPGHQLPCCLRRQAYITVHVQKHKHRQAVLRTSGTREYGTLHYCKYQYFAMFCHELQAFATEVSGQYDN